MLLLLAVLPLVLSQPYINGDVTGCQYDDGKWSPCSASCGHGYQTLVVRATLPRPECPELKQHRSCFTPCGSKADALGPIDKSKAQVNFSGNKQAKYSPQSSFNEQPSIRAPQFTPSQGQLKQAKGNGFEKVNDLGPIRIPPPPPVTTPGPTFPPVAFDCSGKESGLYPNPKEPCSKEFFMCAGSIPFKFTCPGSTYFDAEYSRCEGYNNLPVCSGKPRPPPPPAEEGDALVVALTLRKAVDGGAVKESAIAKALGLSPDKISKVNLISPTEVEVRGNRDLLSSLRDHALRKSELSIDYKGEKISIDHVSVRDQLPKPETYPFDCGPKDNGNYQSADCANAYWVCNGGVTFKMTCPEGTKYDQENDLCETDEYVTGCGGKPRPKPDPKGEALFVPTLDFNCDAVKDGQYGDPKQPCSRRFFHCANGLAYEKPCPGELYFDEEFNACDTFERIPICSGKPRPVDPPPKDGRIVVNFKVAKSLDGVPLETLRSAVASLLSINPERVSNIILSQPTILRFDGSDEILNVLRRFADEGKGLILTYGGLVAPILDVSIDRLETKNERPSYPFDCSNKASGNYQSADCANSYWVCIGGVTEKMTCPGNTMYDQENDLCETRNYVPGCGGTPRTTLPPTTPTGPPTPPPFNCEKMPDGSYKALEPCSNVYYVCANGRFFSMNCPKSQVFLESENRCESRGEIPECANTNPGRPSQGQVVYKELSPESPDSKLSGGYSSSISGQSSVQGSGFHYRGEDKQAKYGLAGGSNKYEDRY